MVPVINNLGLVRNGKCGMQLEEQVWYNTANIKQLDEKVDGLSELPVGVEIGADLPDTATNGTITQEQLDKLKQFEANYIIFKDEIYTPQDKMSDEGYLTYTHVTVEQGVKTITITLSTKAFVVTEKQIGGGSSGGVGDWIEATGPIDMRDSAFNGKYGWYTIEMMVGGRISSGLITGGMEDIKIFTQNGISNSQPIQDMTFYYLSMPFKVFQKASGEPDGALFVYSCNNKPTIIQGNSLSGVTSTDHGNAGASGGYVTSISLNDESMGEAHNPVYYRINYDGGIQQ